MLDASTYEYQSKFAKECVAKGRDEGRAEGREEGQLTGRAELICRQLTLRFGELSDDVRARIHNASIAELDRTGERLLTSPTLQEALAEV